MVVIKEESTEFRWIGNSYRKDSYEHYRSFYLGEEIFQVGDFVIVRNDLALDPEDVSQCYVAQVKDLYETGIEPMPHVAKVQWYSRLFEIPVRFLKEFGKVDSQYEIVEEGRKSMYPNTIDAETIFSRCQVLFLPADTNFELLTPKFENSDVPTFYCRYKFAGKKVIPLMNLEAGCISEPENVYSESRNVKESRPIIEKVKPVNGWKSVDNL
ncbi:origin recognition complex subunit 1-like [Uloborus diversus]|uniref:origin recognition complex subunit 1-like n=1 Tax=Uloborus diversus TaxID=327109 RepID=UPI00240971F9|nr:origin recognition complex subunit 1-like [Uloborus diversus]